MFLRQRLLIALVAAIAGPVAVVRAQGPSVTPLVLNPRGADSVDSGDAMETLRQKLEDKLGAKPDPVSGDRVMRVMNRASSKPAPASGKRSPAARAREGANTEARNDKGEPDLVASASMAREHAAAAGTAVTSIGSATATDVPPVRIPAPWDYHGANSPLKWSKLDPSYAACGTGQRQSPIDIRDGIQVELEPLQFEYKPSAFSVIDDGHTVQVNVEPGNFVVTMGRRYELVEFHFHRPAEEVVEGKRYDMVIHMLHRDSEGRLAMVAVLLEQGAARPVVQTVWNNLPLEKGLDLKAPVKLDPSQLLPSDQRYFTYMGSLTMPPCTEGVLWMVLRQPIQVSEQQIDIFSRLYPMNARPLQEAQGRLIKQN